jgi:AraC-like DNA-binding protein/DNA gyrase inhibitor GyrI
MEKDDRYNERIDQLVHYIEDMIRRDWEDPMSKETLHVKHYKSKEVTGFNEHTAMVTLADKVGMGVRNLELYFKANMHESVKDYIQRRRLDYAQQLLKYSTLSMKDLSNRLGFQNKQALFNLIRKHLDATPQTKKAELCSKVQCTQEKIPSEQKHLPATLIIYVSHIGDYNDSALDFFEDETWDELQKIAVGQGVADENPQYWGIAFDDADITNPGQCLFYAAVSIHTDDESKIKAICKQPLKIGEMTLKIDKMMLHEGDYLVFTYRGAYSGLDAFYDAILQQSGCTLGHGTILEQYCDVPDNCADKRPITKVWVPDK